MPTVYCTYARGLLEDYQRKDALKKAEAEQMGLTFVVLNIAVCKSWKGTRDLLDKEFDHLIFIIRERLSDLSC